MSYNAGNVTGSGATNAYYQNLQSKKSGGSETADGSTESSKVEDKYTGGSANVAGAYSKSSVSAQQLWGMAEAHHASMRSMVEGMLGGVQNSGPKGQAFWSMAAGSGEFDFTNLRVDEATREKAKELIGEDGYFGVKKTTERIMEFAKALAGANPSEKEVDNLRNGVQKGFDAVAKMFGGFDKMPEVSQKTHEATMNAFDEWKVFLGFVVADTKQ
ncbi:MAG: hypothetical protein LBI42_15335 [Chitinispirillales bacterium]|jgi:hypothetical protein|nr:hypothetical protein [Chitinispirillales bacterium]